VAAIPWYRDIRSSDLVRLQVLTLLRTMKNHKRIPFFLGCVIGLAALTFLIYRYAGGSEAQSTRRERGPHATPSVALQAGPPATAPAAQDPAISAPNVSAPDPTAAAAPVERPGAFPGITVIDLPEPPPAALAEGTPRNPLKVFPNPASAGGFVAETDETWAIPVYPPPMPTPPAPAEPEPGH
jgi:hypothetical protein